MLTGVLTWHQAKEFSRQLMSSQMEGDFFVRGAVIATAGRVPAQ